MRLGQAVVTGCLALSVPVIPATAAPLDAQACRWLVRHVPAPDVAYRPGVDARGRPVAPADLPGSPSLQVPDGVRIDVTVDVARRLGLPVGRAVGAEAVVGTIAVEGDRLLFNGAPLADEQAATLAAACRGGPG